MSREKRAVIIADMLRSLQSGERTVRELEDITGMQHEYLGHWLTAFEAVGLIQQGAPRKVDGAKGRTPKTWTMA